ncbi:MAG: hypothetical protein GX275_07940 [Clostridiales bacterium]|nr:hypothetical protein [Clostridiales bacterium]
MKIIPNIFSFFRIVVTFGLVLGMMNNIISFSDFLILSILILLSDFLDGKLARKLKVESVFGAKLDIFADLLYIVSCTSILVFQDILHIKILICILFEFGIFIITSKKVKKENNEVFYFDLLGRLLAGFFYILPVFAMVVYNCFGKMIIIDLVEWTCIIATVIVVMERIYLVKRNFIINRG